MSRLCWTKRQLSGILWQAVSLFTDATSDKNKCERAKQATFQLAIEWLQDCQRTGSCFCLTQNTQLWKIWKPSELVKSPDCVLTLIIFSYESTCMLVLNIKPLFVIIIASSEASVGTLRSLQTPLKPIVAEIVKAVEKDTHWFLRFPTAWIHRHSRHKVDV